MDVAGESHLSAGELFEKLNAGDVLIVTELSRIGRSTIEVLSIVKELVQNGVDIVFIGL